MPFSNRSGHKWLRNRRLRCAEPIRRRRPTFEPLEFRHLLAAGSVVINEINYNPPDKTKPTEFVELTNPGTTAVDLSGASFVNGIHYTFPAGTTLPAGGYVVVSENPAALQTAYGVTSFGPWDGKLSNSGEDVKIVDAAGNQLDDVSYGATFPWPTIGDSPGPGYDIELINPTLDNSLGGNWRSYNPAAPKTVTLIAKGSSWEYRKGTAEATPASNAIGSWRGLDYVEDSNWKTGTLPIGYDPAGGPTMSTKLTDVSGSYTSVFLRKTFSIPDPAEVLGLTLQAMYDDGFNVWINGRLAQTVNTPGENTAFNGLASTARSGSDPTYLNFTINPTFLQAGDNEIAVQFFNAAKTDSDAFFDAALIETTGTGGPTPGKQNAVFAANAAPSMRQVVVTPQMPTPGTTATITAKVTDPDGVASVTLSYQLVDAGNYIAVQDAAYTNPANWTTVTMHDDGLNGDAVADDGIYAYVMPASVQVNRRLVRYRITSTDSLGASITGPYADDPLPDFAYYVYAGVPAYSAALQPGASGASGQVQTFSTSTLTSLPVIQLITKQQDHDNAQHIPGSNSPASTGNEYTFSGTLVYNGVVYDDIHYRARGGVWRYAMGKNMWKIDFENGHDFQAYYPDGTPYPTAWKKLDLGADIQQGDIGDRGEQGLFETLGFELFGLAGVPSEATIPTSFRIVESASETGTSQYTTDFQGLYLMVEEPDGRFLDSHGLPDGNLYKIEGGAGTSKNQGPTQPSDGSDLTAFITMLNSNPSEQWLEDNIDLDEFYSYQAVTEFIHNWDIGFGKNYLHYHNPDTNKWEIIPWDLDLTQYVNYEPSGGDITPFTSAILSHPDLQLQYRDRVRELEDLLFTPEQIGKLADGYANLVNPLGTGPTIVQADAAMWDYNPIESSSSVNASKATPGRFYLNGQPTQDFAGMVARLKTFESSRLSYLDTTVITTADANAAPLKPTVSYAGATGFPVGGLTFSTSAFAAGSSGGTFAGMEWRIADVTNQSTLDPSMEINSVWDSGVITTFNSSIAIPSTIGLIPGHVYRVRVRMEDSNGRWSHWSDVSTGVSQFVATATSNVVKNSLRITELNYDPAAGAPFNNDDYEFVEVENFGTQTINLAGVAFTDGINFVFGNVSLAPGQVGVLVHNTAAFQSRYGTTPLILGDYLSTGQAFSNGGEHVELVDAFGQPITDFTYSPNWYPTTHGQGASLEVTNPAINPDLNNSANWRASTSVNGTPGVGSSAGLPAPTGAEAITVTTSQVTLQWTDNATTEQGYAIFRRTSGGQLTQIASLPANSNLFADNNNGAGLTPGVQYEYLIQAFNATTFSDPADVVVNLPPLAPINLVGTPGTNSIALRWSVPVGAVTYNVYRGSTSGGEGATPFAANLPTPAFTDTSITTGNNYFYFVTADTPAGVESAPSSEISQLLGAVDVYSFEEGAGTTTTDSVGGNNGTLQGNTLPTWVPGQVGAGALSFSGDGTYLQTTAESAVKVNNNLATVLGSTSTLSVWVKTTQVGNNTHYMAPAITGAEQNGGSSDINWGTLNASGQIGVFVGDTGGIYSTNPINNGQWHNVVLTRDAGTGTVQLYVDGVLNGTASLGSGNKTSQFFLIGALSDVASNGTTFSGANYFNGSIDELRIYNRVLSTAEVAALSTAPSVPAGFTATAQSASTIQLNWTNGSVAAQNIEVDRKTGAGSTYSQFSLLPGGSTTFTDINRIAGTEYFYKIRAIGLAGNSAFTAEVSDTPPVPSIVARYRFYNGSKFDADSSDAFAIATDKQALLPGQTATFQNYSSYSDGINGIMIDVANLDGTVSGSDFTFRVGNSSDTSTWQTAPNPASILVFPSGGGGGSTRVELIWNDNAVQNQWLQVTLKADAVTQLSAPDVFYFGNAIGESGNSATDADVNASDALGVRGHLDAGTVAISNPWDFNRDGDVDATDISLAMQNISAAGAALQLITAPNGGGAGSSVADVSPQVDSMALGSNATGQPANQSTASSTAVQTSGSNPLLGSSLFFGSSSPSAASASEPKHAVVLPIATSADSEKKIPTLTDLEIVRFTENRVWKRLSIFRRDLSVERDLFDF